MTIETHKRQVLREQGQVLAGIERYRRDMATKDAADMAPGRALIKRAVQPVAEAIEALVEHVESGKAGAGRPAVAVRYLQALQPEVVAYITARTCINAACKGDRLPKTAMALAGQIADHYQFDELRAAEPKLSNSMERKAKKWSTPFHRKTIMRLAARIANVKGLEWEQGDKLHLGLKLIELFVTSTGLVEQVLTSEGTNNTSYRLRPTPSCADWLARMHGKCELLEPRYLPMIAPPKPWTTPIDGGYYTRENRVDFIGGISTALRDDVFSVDMADVYRAVNAVQSTPWRINLGVYEVMDSCWRAGLSIAGLPSADPLPIPERPSSIPSTLPRANMDEATRAAFDAWRRDAADAHESNAALISKRLALVTQLSLAKDLTAEPEFYFPHNVDFRGRIYSVVPGLCPQGDDAAKGLLEFAVGKPLGEHGGYWLAVHIANLFGVDKVSFDDRVQWVSDNHERLLDSAVRPLEGERFWTEADKPWCALAACMEWAGYAIAGPDFISHLPIAMDGSCSGLQHFSAMLRDADGGRAVNLTQQDTPADIYTAVMHKVEELLQHNPEQLAISWRGKVTRKIVKRPCMTFAYSVTSRGMRDQIMDELRRATPGAQYLPGWENFEAATFLAPIVEDAIRATVDRAAEAMDWLKAAVRAVVEADMPVVWFTPDGFPVQHRYVKTTGKRFKCWFDGVRMDVQLRVDGHRQDGRKQASAIAPNYVHSMDGTHLRRVVNRMTDADITRSFAMVHDSFGVHACDVDDLHYAIRDEFIWLYRENRLAEFRDQVLAMLPVERHADVPPVPAAGDLDLDGILKADFFFA